MKLRYIAFYAAIIIIGLLLIFQLGQLQDLISLLRSARWWMLLFLLPLRYLYYLANSKFFARFFTIFHSKVEPAYLLEATVTMNFVNIVFPSAGISGISYIRKAFSGQVSSANTTLAQLVWYILTFVCYVVLLAIGFVILLFSGQQVGISMRFVLFIVTILLMASTAVLVLLFQKDLTQNITFALVRPLNFLLHRFHKRNIGKERIRVFYSQLKISLDFLREHQKKLGIPFVYAFAMTLLDIATLYVVALAFGAVLNPAVVIVAFVLALLASLASVFTAGIGAYEAGMITSFVALGLSFDLAFSITFTYRLLTLWAFLPVGLFFYKRTLLDTESKPR